VPYQAIEVSRLVGLVVALVSVGQSKTPAGCLLFAANKYCEMPRPFQPIWAGNVVVFSPETLK
jgi:hypothetical protein